MERNALINNQVVILSEEDRKAGEEFHKRRYAFAWVKGKLIFNDNKQDDRDHQHWLLEDYEVSIDEFERLNRGYMLEDRIQLFKGSRFEPIDTVEISVSDFDTLLKTHGRVYNSNNVVIYNGVVIGNIGEVWEPLMVYGTYNI